MTNGQLPLEQQTAIVTGASSGIGRDIAVAMAKAGARVVVNYASSADAAKEVVEEIQSSKGQAIAVQADVSKEAAVESLFDEAIEHFGAIHILVNNAGIQKDASFEEMTLDQWQRVIDINLTGSFLCARRAVREFLARGVRPEISKAAGKIIFISSVHELIPWAGHVNYAASKGGLMLMMKSLAQEFAPKKIRVNSIAPGAIKTRINQEAWQEPEAAAKLLKLIPSGRVGEPEDVSKAAVWLASDEADYLHGATLFIDGGMALYPEFAHGG